MPIRPENVARYPKDWQQIRDAIVARARNRCEHCGVRNGALGGRTREGYFLRALPLGERRLRLEWPRPGDYWWCSGLTGELHGIGYQRTERLRIIRIVLTVAHLDHAPENCAPENLRAWCQRCHLAYDAKHHRETAYSTRRAGRAVADLFQEEA